MIAFGSGPELNLTRREFVFFWSIFCYQQTNKNPLLPPGDATRKDSFALSALKNGSEETANVNTRYRAVKY